jgi:CheY-like chemotaxis protein
VREFSGRVLVLDREGGGAMFRVELPVARVASMNEPSKAGKAAPNVTANILFVEDDALVADLLSRQLALAGYRSSIELDARRALETIVSLGDSFDLIYCDLMMKGFTGMDLAETLETRAPAQMKKIVFMTGGAFTPRARVFREGHADQCVDKPFDIVAETARRLASEARS